MTCQEAVFVIEDALVPDPNKSVTNSCKIVARVMFLPLHILALCQALFVLQSYNVM